MDSSQTKKRKKVQKACIPCRKAHVSCDEGRPCSRCVKKGISEKCVDAPRTIEIIKRNNPVRIAPKVFSSGFNLYEQKQNNSNAFKNSEHGNEEPNFFELFSRNSELPMDDPNLIFNTLNPNTEPIIQKQRQSTGAVPTCFSEPNKNDLDMLDLEELFLPLPSHICKSRGLSACNDCSFNIDNFLPQPARIDESSQTPILNSLKSNELDLLSSASMADVDIMNPLKIDFHQTTHLEPILNSAGIEVPIISHINFLVRKLNSSTNSPKIINFPIKTYVQNIRIMYPATPSCVISPSGLIRNYNNAFTKLLGMNDSYLEGFCLFSLLDLSSILGILDLCQKYLDSDPTGFGRCTFRLAERTRPCSSSLSLIISDGKLWIAAQFIPL
jgi:hypothetical protein